MQDMQDGGVLRCARLLQRRGSEVRFRRESLCENVLTGSAGARLVEGLRDRLLGDNPRLARGNLDDRLIVHTLGHNLIQCNLQRYAVA